MSELTKYTKVEMELLEAVQDGKKKSLSEIFPDDLEPKLVVKWSRAAGSLANKKDGELAVSLHIAGRFHCLARINPAVLQEAQCSDIEEYTEKILCCAQHRSTIYKFSSAYKEFPDLTPERAASIGTENLVRATKIAKSSKASPAQKEIVLKQAENLNVDGFKEWGENKSGLSAPGETTSASFTLTGTLDQIRELEGWLKDARFIAYAETDRPIELILTAIQASCSEWPPEIQAGIQKEADGW